MMYALAYVVFFVYLCSRKMQLIVPIRAKKVAKTNKNELINAHKTILFHI